VLSPARRDSRRLTSTRAVGRAAERRAAWHYRLRGYRILAANEWVGPYELDLVVRRGRSIAFVEVKDKGGTSFGDPLEMVTEEKQRRLRLAAEAWLTARPDLAGCECRFDVVAVRGPRLERLEHAF
jgi:putative endonuclease